MARHFSTLFLAFYMFVEAVHGQGGSPARRPAPASYQAPDLKPLVPAKGGDLREALPRYETDLGSLSRFYDLTISPNANASLRNFYTAWRSALDRLDFDSLGLDGRIDFLLFRNKLDRELRQLEQERMRMDEIGLLVPFAADLIAMQEARQRVDPVDPAQAAAAVVRIIRQVEELSKTIDTRKTKRTVASRAARTIDNLRQTLKQWFQFYNGYDPVFTWWVAEPYKQLDKNLESYSTLVREKLAGIKKDDRDTIVGDPIGREALLAELASEMIPYTPEELIAIANQELAWCEREMLRAARDLGYGEDWRRALEHVKNLYAPPGKQTALILEQAIEAIDYVQERDLVTVPSLARDTWRMEMMSPERQRINPFFLGGEVITVSFPTDGMTHEQKMMSMRGNNIHFSRSTVFHELIPGHHLQQFMNARHRPYRRVFRTPFWMEGWALYWEMLLWDSGFPKTPENRIGMLFWRMHRCARIVFSLSFHLEKMTAQESVDFLVDRIGHERENASAEVRRSFETNYAPLYQAAYLLGGLQFRALHKELVGSSRMTNRQFHDAILQLNQLPVEMVRASLTNQRIRRDFSSQWKFYAPWSH